MKRNIKKILVSIALCATSVFALAATGCGFSGDLSNRIEQLQCNHKYDSGEVTTEATCLEAGEKTKTCTLCGKTKTEKIAVKGHEYGESIITKLATCTTVGEEIKTCTVCDMEITATIPAKGHTFDSGITLETATCKTTGKIQYSCMECGEAKTQTVAKLPHTIVDIPGAEATCLASGLSDGQKCMTCETVVMQQVVIPALGHKVVKDAAVPASCESTGLTVGNHCERCNEVLVAQEIVPAKGHTIVSVGAEDPTCTANGYSAGTECSSCGLEFSGREVIAPLGHEYKGVDCIRCDDMREVTLDMLEDETAFYQKEARVGDSVVGKFFIADENSKFVIRDGVFKVRFRVKENSVIEDYTSDGVLCRVEHYGATSVFCISIGDDVALPSSVYGGSYTVTANATFEPYEGSMNLLVPYHENCVMNQGIVTKAATCDEQGEIVYSCKYCAETMKTVTVASTGHNWVETSVTTESTCLNDGVALYTCSGCGETKDVTVNALGHSYIDGKCVRCGDTYLTVSGMYMEKGAALSVSADRPSMRFTATLTEELAMAIANGDYSEFGFIQVNAKEFSKIDDGKVIDFVGEMTKQGISFYTYPTSIELNNGSPVLNYYHVIDNILYKSINTEYVVFPYVKDGRGGASEYKYPTYPMGESMTEAARSAVYLAVAALNDAELGNGSYSEAKLEKFHEIVSESAHLALGYRFPYSGKQGTYVVRFTKDSISCKVGDVIIVDVQIGAYVEGTTDENSYNFDSGVRIPIFFGTLNELSGECISVDGMQTTSNGEASFMITDKLSLIVRIKDIPATVCPLYGFTFDDVGDTSDYVIFEIS